MAKIQRKKQPNRRLTPKQVKALTHLVEHGGKMSDALRAAGYSPAIVNNPQKVTTSTSFAAALDRAGVSDTRIAKKYSRLIDAGRIEHEHFYGVQGANGEWKYPTKEAIKKVIEGKNGETGCTLKMVQTDHTQHYVIATYWHPENAVQMGMIDKVGKVKSHFAPERVDVVTHELDETERNFLEGINIK